MDFGSILCWATNDIGRQIQPCVFHLLPAGKPDPVSNCTVASSSYSTMRIYCEPGFNGGLKQTFTLEIRETESSSHSELKFHFKKYKITFFDIFKSTKTHFLLFQK